METTTITTDISNTPKSLFRDKEHYLKFVAAFKKSSQAKNLRTVHFMLYAILRNRDWRKGFTSTTNKNKLANGRKPNDTLNHSLMVLRSMLKHGTNDWQVQMAARELVEFNTIFGDTITAEMLEQIHDFLPMWNVEGKFPEMYTTERRAA